MEIQDILQEVFNSEFIKKRYFELKKQNTADFSERDFLSGIANYCVILKSKEDVEVFANIDKNSDRVEFLKEKIAQRLGIKNNSNNEKEIFKYACNELYTEGFVFHVTNSVDAKEIMKNGFDSNKKPLNDELVKIGRILKKYNAASLIGWRQFDDEQSKGWFYDETPENLYSYAAGPEWFKQFCGENLDYAGIVEDNKRSAFKFRDYEQALKNVQGLIETKKMNENDKNEILDFFEKNWKKYGSTYPTMLMIPRKKIIENTINWSIKDMLKEVIFSSHGKINCNSCENINPEDIKMVNLSNIFYRFDHEKNNECGKNVINKHDDIHDQKQINEQTDLEEISFNDCIQIVRGFDFKSTHNAKKLMKIMQKRKERIEKRGLEGR